ncbi:transmembrane protein 26-like [Salarias fasciatus]|uniref:transmembrane protein 26-like n=1 Tax=Salarias fasciatus TaxID=181472 RepID=UPI001176CAF6|nr:transmembrane protein 26-like [Salarias fasciatus]
MCNFVSAIITRALFILAALYMIFEVAKKMQDANFWYLTFLFLPLVAEMIVTLKNRKGKDYKWFSPPIFLFLVSIIPSFWILELYHQKETVEVLRTRYKEEKLTQHVAAQNNLLPKIRLSVYSLSLQSYDRMLSFCYKDESLADYQVLLVLLILGKWLLPLGGGITKEELSQLLLNFVGTAADILEYLSETLPDAKEFIPEMIYTILAVWTWSMLQFPLHLSVVNSKADSEKEDEDSPDVSLWSKHSTDIWSIMEALFIQNGPFLVIRIIVMIYSKSVNEMTIFFAIKNFLVVILSLYRLIIICYNFRQSRRVAETDSKVP